MEELLYLGVLVLAFVIGFLWALFFFFGYTYMRTTIFSLPEATGKLKLSSACNLAGESSKIFSG